MRLSVAGEVLLGEHLDDSAPPDRHHRQDVALFRGCRAEPQAGLVEPYRARAAMGDFPQACDLVEPRVALPQDEALGASMARLRGTFGRLPPGAGCRVRRVNLRPTVR